MNFVDGNLTTGSLGIMGRCVTTTGLEPCIFGISRNEHPFQLGSLFQSWIKLYQLFFRAPFTTAPGNIVLSELTMKQIARITLKTGSKMRSDAATAH